MDEAAVKIGGQERGVPSAWRFSIDMATTRKQCALMQMLAQAILGPYGIESRVQ